RGWIAFQHADLEGQQVAFVRGALVYGNIDEVARGLLVIEGVVLDVPNHVLRLRALDELGDEFAGENRIFAQVFERSAVARLAGDIHAAAQGHVVALRAQFGTDQRAQDRKSTRL